MSGRDKRIARIKGRIVTTVRLWHEADVLASANDPENVDTAHEVRMYDAAMQIRDQQERRLRDLCYELNNAEEE